MITRLQVKKYRCLRSADQRLRRLNILIGPNACGKSTFLDAIEFIGDLLRIGPGGAFAKRSSDSRDMFYCKDGNNFEIAVEVDIPESLRRGSSTEYTIARYEVKVGELNDAGEIGLLGERLELRVEPVPRAETKIGGPALKDEWIEDLNSVYISQTRGRRNCRTVIHKMDDGKDRLYSEKLANKGKGWIHALSLGPQTPALRIIPEEQRFPVALWLRDFLQSRVQRFVLSGHVMQAPSPPGQQKELTQSGSNLPWVIEKLQRDDEPQFRAWLQHVKTALPDICDIHIRELPDNRSRYIAIEYPGRLIIPSWSVSDGTLRMLALTVLAYLREKDKLYMIEEPENGIHPRAVEPVLESLSSVYDSQVLLATHSPVVLGLVDAKDLLCFRRVDGNTRVTSGENHPALADWKGEVSLDALFASGILD